MRKVIQIAVFGPGTAPRLYALCDDGSIWCYQCWEWNRVDDIPQEEGEKRTEHLPVELPKEVPPFPGKRSPNEDRRPGDPFPEKKKKAERKRGK